MIVNRREQKYIISESDYHNIMNMLKKVLKEDKNNNEFGYNVRSIYFDSIDDSDFYNKMSGEDIRKKIRLRVYSIHDKRVKLEIKRKINISQVKETVEISREDAIRLINKEYEVLLNYNNPTAQAAYNIMAMHQYKPVVLIEYSRQAFIHEENNIRVTIDRDIRSNESDFDIFSENINLTPIFNDYTTVLEIKYDGEFFCWISEVMEGKEFTYQSLSKYCNGRKMFDCYLA